MGNTPNVLWGGLFRTGLVVLLSIVAAPSMAQAAGPAEKVQGLWMAASSPDAVFGGRAWGRLILNNGELTFQSTDYEWRLPLTAIARVDISKDTSRLFEVESASGQIYYVAILDGQLLTDSPRKAVQMIERAIRDTPTTSRQGLVARGSR